MLGPVMVHYREQFNALLRGPAPLLILAPMQGITDLPFWRLQAQYQGADVYFTEYFRVHPTSRLTKHILRSVTENPTGRPVVAQLIGNDIPSLVRSAKELERQSVAAVDLNLGCPAPVVYRKCAGGGLLREPEKIDAILGAMRDAISIKFTVKTRVGFDDPRLFEKLLPIYARHSLDLLTVHARTVKEMYRPPVHYELIAQAAQAMPCPVVANGDIFSPAGAESVLQTTGAKGLMLGRGAIRNPWLFQQIRQQLGGQPVQLPTGRDVLRYVRALYEEVCDPGFPEAGHVAKMKKYLVQIALGAEPTGRFLHEIRRVETQADFFKVCEAFLDHDERLALVPFRSEGR